MAEKQLSGMSVGDLAYEYVTGDPRTTGKAALAELERRTEQAKPIPEGHVRLPDGRVVRVSEPLMNDLLNMLAWPAARDAGKGVGDGK